nr:MAG TPA: Flagellar transcriptional activator (FlhC) [Caudoviricetes sp.]
MNKRQAKKLYKKIHGHNPPEGRIPVVLLRDSSKEKKHTGRQIDAPVFNLLEQIETELRIPRSVLESICSINKPKVNMKIMTREEHERITIATRCFGKTMNNAIRQMNSRFRTMRERLKGNDDPVVITTRKLSENRKKNKGTAWRRARRNR